MADAKSSEQAVLMPPAPPPADDAPEGAPDWIVTFADLATLLLCFFVLLLSFSRMDDERFKEVAGSLKEAFGVQRITPVMDLPRGVDLIARDFNAQFTAELVERLRAAIKQAGGKAEGASVEESARGLLINLPGAILFASASADLSADGEAVLAALLPIFQEVGGEIHIEGHSDDTPFGGRRGVFDGNWQLSFDRALGVLRFFIERGKMPTASLVPIGRGASVPVASNDTEIGRQANRRVEILMLKGFSTKDDGDTPGTAANADASAGDRGDASSTAGASDAAAASGVEPELHIPEANYSPTERTVSGSGGPVSLFPENY
jgi:chemotaxis protein MotB